MVLRSLVAVPHGPESRAAPCYKVSKGPRSRAARELGPRSIFPCCATSTWPNSPTLLRLIILNTFALTCHSIIQQAQHRSLKSTPVQPSRPRPTSAAQLACADDHGPPLQAKVGETPPTWISPRSSRVPTQMSPRPLVRIKPSRPLSPRRRHRQQPPRADRRRTILRTRQISPRPLH